MRVAVISLIAFSIALPQANGGATEVTPLSFRDQVSQEIKKAEEALAETARVYLPQEKNPDYYSRQNDYYREIIGRMRKSLLLAQGQSQQDLVSKLRDGIAKMEEMLGRRTLAEFRLSLRQEIDWAVRKERDSAALKSLLQATECLGENRASDQAKTLLAGMFEQLFQLFSQKPRLTDGDCVALKKAHMLWSSFYDSSNEAVELASGKSIEKIPLYNVNAHNSTVFYWLKEMARGRIPDGGLPLLHADTHTDLGHIHNHLAGSHWAHGVDVPEIGRLLRLEDKTQLKAHLAKTVIPKLDKMSEEAKVQAIKQIEAADSSDLQAQIEQSMRERVHHIAQPILGAVATGMTNKVIMCLPPWSKNQMERSKLRPDGTVAIENMFFVKDQNQLALRSKSYMEILGRAGASTGEILSTIPTGALDCNSEVRNEESGNVSVVPKQQSGIPDLKQFFSNSEAKKGFILDIDLDVFVSNGRPEKGVAEPISFARTREHDRLIGKHGTHDEGTETDPDVFVSAKELRLIQGRIDHFFDQLKDAKANGILPKVITIADSTLLERAVDTARMDSTNGGNYTPECLAFLVNYKVRKKLAELYPIQQAE